MLEKFADTAKERINEIQNLIDQIVDENGNLREGKTVEELKEVKALAEYFNNKLEDETRALKELGNDVSEHKKEVACTRKKMLNFEKKYNYRHPSWMRKAWRL